MRSDIRRFFSHVLVHILGFARAVLKAAIMFATLSLVHLSSFGQQTSGTGFFITSSGYLATNYHVIDGANQIVVRKIDGTLKQATVVLIDRKNDLAILKVEATGVHPLVVAPSNKVRRGERVFTVGFPNVTIQGVAPKLTEGSISSLSGIFDESNSFQISVPIQPGNSGGPLIDESGRVVGVIVAKLVTGQDLNRRAAPENVNYAIKSDHLLELVRTNRQISSALPVSSRPTGGRNLADLGEFAERSVVLIISSSVASPGTGSAPDLPNSPPRQAVQPPKGDFKEDPRHSAPSVGVVWIAVTPFSAGNFHTRNIETFASEIETATAGRLKIKIYPNGGRIKAPEIKRAVQDGLFAQAGEVLLSAHSNENPLFGMDSLPFLATSYTDAARLWVEQKPFVKTHFLQQGLIVLFSVPWQPQGLFSTKALSGLGDMKGLKLRAYNPLISRVAELAGALPVTIGPNELVRAYATGAVHANFASSATGYEIRSWEMTRYYYDVQAWLPKNVFFVNKKAFDTLDINAQRAVLKAAVDAETRGWRISEDMSRYFAAELEKKGVSVLTPAAQLVTDFQTIGAQVTQEWIRTAGPDSKSVVEAFRK